MRLKKLLNFYWFALLFVVVIFLRLPSLFEPFTYGDEGIYLTLGLAVRKGLTLYSQIHDNKPPMLYLLAALAGNFAYFRVLLLAWSLVTIYVFWRLAEKIFPKNQKAVIIAAFAFGILTSIHTFEGNIGNAENFMLLPTILGVILVLKSLDSHGLGTDLHRFFFAGTMFSLATLFKVPAAFDFLAIFIFLVLVFLRKKKYYILHTTYYILFPLFLGFLLPILITIFYYASKGALDQYLSAAFLQNIPYLTSWGTGSHTKISLLKSGLAWRGIILLVLGSWFLVLGKKRFSEKFLFVIIWFLFSLFAALLSSRPYPHYLIQVLPSLSLLLAFGLTSKLKTERILAFFSIFYLLSSIFYLKFWYYSNIPYYKNFYQYLLGQKSKAQYFADFDPKANDIYQAADFIVNHSLPEEKIFVWGNEPYLYALSRRLPPGRYTTAYHIIDFDGGEETINTMVKERVNLVIMAPIDREFPALKALLEQKYIKIGEAREYSFYQRIFNF